MADPTIKTAGDHLGLSCEDCGHDSDCAVHGIDGESFRIEDPCDCAAREVAERRRLHVPVAVCDVGEHDAQCVGSLRCKNCRAPWPCRFVPDSTQEGGHRG